MDRMEQHGDEVHTSETEASGGSKEGVVRWVLIVGLVLAVAFLTLIWTTGALLQDDGADSETSVSNTIAAQQDEAEDRETIEAPTFGNTAETDSGGPGDAPAGDPRTDSQ